MAELRLELCEEGRIVLELLVCRPQLIDCMGQCLTDEAAAVDAEVAGSIRLVVVGHIGNWVKQPRRPRFELPRQNAEWQLDP